jgi:hypothetical protein
MTFNEESLRKGIQFGLGSQGIWKPELEDKMFEEIKNQALRQDAVIKSFYCSDEEHLKVEKCDEICNYCKDTKQKNVL